MYEDARKELFKDRPDKYVSLMDIALMGMRKLDRKSTRLNSSHDRQSRMPSSA